MEYYNYIKGKNNFNCQLNNVSINDNQETLSQILTYLEGLQKEVISLKNTVSELNEKLSNYNPTGPVIHETILPQWQADDQSSLR
jgi:negative regulator of sigma E activity